ncbi:MAG: hypothetical protein K2L45_05060 [Muribaculaceae bacterium]|nr:hypothetical protein [Muribaculaceae bacterium]
MGFWNYLGLAFIFKQVFGKKNPSVNTQRDFSLGNYSHEELDRRYSVLSSRIDDLESRLHNRDYDADEYEDLCDEIEDFRDELEDLEFEQDMLNLDDFDEF